MIFPRVVFIGGKGGVGKSTISSSIAKMLSLNGKKVLLISTDPAHNLKDIFDIEKNNQFNTKLQILELNPQKEAKEYIENVSNATKEFISPNSYEMLDNYYNIVKESATAQESAMFDKLIKIISEDVNFDHIVIDTAPTGHTLRLFKMPKNLKIWSELLLKQREKNSNLQNIIGNIEGKDILKDNLENRHLRYSKFLNILKDFKQCGIIFVLNLEILPINETLRAIEELQIQKIAPFAIIINKIPPNSNDEFFKNRFEISLQNLKLAKKLFKDFSLLEIPLYNKDISSEADLEFIIKHIKSFII
ncbi:ArsA family ATPase [Campylobacter subantarcticus]|uniref:arsenite-transporting ATPase n=1 Tax=Campylobacter subantarcticus LMG 24374 TaxID=1388751 RepID=A0A0A8HBL5_9BACT|nr:ArsA family ATPase [Campylobacter subantarcticus]AJC91377.1 arsenite-transporting ATPase [Campylobacter subantarcticus LMG 24374]EAJ1261029.1 ArsA family ATPase [Campylobacter lari]EAJ1262059.1 ArsA family ATPase [Campylobacter lari]